MSNYEDVVSRCNKMSFLLGLATGGLSELIRLDLRPQEQKQPTIDLLNKLMLGVEQLYYVEVSPRD